MTAISRDRSYRRFLSLLFPLALVVLIGCGDDHDHGSGPDHHEEEAVGIVLSIDGTEILRGVDDDGRVTLSKLHVPAVGDTTGTISVAFVSEDGDEFVPDESDLSLDIELSGSSVGLASIDAANYQFKLEGLSPGMTELAVVILHGTHADYRSIPVEITVE